MVLQHGDECGGVPLRHGVTEAVVAGDGLCGLGQQTAVVLQEAREYRLADIELALDFAASTAARSRRNVNAMRVPSATLTLET
jgi:hypothetical protein